MKKATKCTHRKIEIPQENISTIHTHKSTKQSTIPASAILHEAPASLTEPQAQNTCTAQNASHVSVLLEEVMHALLETEDLKDNAIKKPLWFLDGTLGLAGHSATLLKRLQEKGIDAHLVGLDRDPQALERAKENLAPFANKVHLFETDYASYESILPQITHPDFHGRFNGILLDLGVSSLQLDVAERGFSYHKEGPLNMRMDTSCLKNQTSTSTQQNPTFASVHAARESHVHMSAQEFIANADLATLRRVIEEFGEDPQAQRIAKAIIEERQRTPITSTKQLADIVYHAYPAKWRATARNHPATRTFQAIRMFINDELGQLSHFLKNILSYTEEKGIIAIISFHSLEDRIVKQKFKEWATDCLCPAHIPRCVCQHTKEARILTKKPILPTQEENHINPRASSAKLRIAQK